LGDFDYNGFVDDDDVTLLGAFYDANAAPLAAPTAEATASVAAVPEPSTWAIVLSAAVTFCAGRTFRRRRRR
jgi:hypothetical protein